MVQISQTSSEGRDLGVKNKLPCEHDAGMLDDDPRTFDTFPEMVDDVFKPLQLLVKQGHGGGVMSTLDRGMRAGSRPNFPHNSGA